MHDPFEDLTRAASLIRRAQDARLRALGLTKAQLKVLRMISSQRLPWTYTELAASLLCDIKAVTEAVERLGHHVDVAPDSQDKRKTRVTATKAGRLAVKRAGDLLRRVEDELLRGLDEEEQDRFFAELEKIARYAADSLSASSE